MMDGMDINMGIVVTLILSFWYYLSYGFLTRSEKNDLTVILVSACKITQNENSCSQEIFTNIYLDFLIADPIIWGPTIGRESLKCSIST